MDCRPDSPAHRRDASGSLHIGSLIVFDGDNTLWDTNEVFLNAQLEFIDCLSENGIQVGHSEGIIKLREIDQGLIGLLGRAEYDFVYLWRALVNHYEHGKMNISQDELQVPLKGEDIPVQRFLQRLTDMPQLLPEAKDTVRALNASLRLQGHCLIGIFSEGKLSRLRRVFEHHSDLITLMDFVAVGAKTPENYLAIVNDAGMQHSSKMMVGDSIRKDIEPAHLAGYTTVFIPSRYVEQNAGVEASVRADFTLGALQDLPPLFHSLLDVGRHIST